MELAPTVSVQIAPLQLRSPLAPSRSVQVLPGEQDEMQDAPQPPVQVLFGWQLNVELPTLGAQLQLLPGRHVHEFPAQLQAALGHVDAPFPHPKPMNPTASTAHNAMVFK